MVVIDLEKEKKKKKKREFRIMDNENGTNSDESS